MPDDQNIPPNTPTPDSSPATGSEPVNMPPEPLESPRNTDNPISLKDANEVINEPNAPSENEGIRANEPLAEPNPELVSEPIQATEPRTAQISRNEPLNTTEATPPVASSMNHMRELQAREQLAIQNKKRKKLDLILTLFAKRKNITNDELEKFLHVSDATATRYLSILEKEGKIKQNGKTGHMVSYSRI